METEPTEYVPARLSIDNTPGMKKLAQLRLKATHWPHMKEGPDFTWMRLRSELAQRARRPCP
eukprot:8844937-Alexandrium_andersonii.AAC.1